MTPSDNGGERPRRSRASDPSANTPSRFDELLGKAVIIACLLLFAQVVWVGIQGAIDSQKDRPNAAPESSVSADE